jgi:hypothetical protein
MGFPTAVLFPDTSLLLTGRIRDALTARPEAYASGVFVGTAVPNPRTDRMVIVRRAGGPRLDWSRERARIVIEVWAAENAEKDLHDLADLTRALIVGMTNGEPFTDARESAGPSRIYDEAGQPQPRMRFTVDITVRGADLAPA